MAGERKRADARSLHTPYSILHTRAQRGVTTMLVIAFMGIFLLIMGTITSYIFEQAKYGRALYSREQALSIAEAGLEYYRWFLAHNPNNLTNGTGLPGPYTYTVSDPEGGTLGSASISVAGNSQCGVIQSIDITSQGASDSNTTFKRTLLGRYMRRSVAAYSYLLNSNVWAGADRAITGQYFSNGGIRMDGSNNSDVSSALTTWNCTSSYGCSPAVNPAAGVLGSGSGSALWHNSAASIDFAGIATSLTNLKTYAQTGGGLYFAPSTGSVNSRGYHMIFKSNGTVDVYRVTGTTGITGYPDGSTATTEYNIIATQNLLGNYTVPSGCRLIFVEDRVWVEGVVSGKVTIVAATPSDTGTTPYVILPNNLTYATNDGTAGFTAISESDVLIPLNSPNVMEIHGIFVAHNGRYGRNHYTTSSLISQWDPYVLRSQLTTVGTIVSSGRTGTKWINTSTGVTTSGYQTRIDAYDQLQATDPPPFTPSASTDYSYVLWREQ
ncbi:hypothetical protein HY971_03125 [Candidatus Kaiserbacteria bacterium]|nr:hypothetical protein [Candidatus Kaiserbacteria bacterium]